MSSISAIAVSGLKAATRRLEVSASNVANQQSTGALPTANGAVPAGAPQAYTPLQVTQTAVPGSGTQTSVTPTTPGTIAIADPQAPFADESGMVAAPNVDLAQELIGQMVAKYSYTANLATLKADRDMTKALLDTTA
ncbi:putative flagellar basal-body rod protein flgC [Rhodopseudomonas palustris HaA2]|uniref:Putative flagellar basal-body rod protein flgC n=1 Tax=Rhodopseudomonas palustris (strain HaA2) TaxID=316058 RepID=Q2J3X4_RHOP2|nr:flagellar basal body rod C-terminal domain-containing protein [Rhodopseudomonas palustris]ABD04836.1 putative flagellar basal-body rod protein flgC [Rhodopseudomonas palustris HaA2]